MPFKWHWPNDQMLRSQICVAWLLPKPQQAVRFLKVYSPARNLLGRINKILMLLPFSRWLRICSRTAAKLLNSGEESSIVSKQDRSIRVFTENLWKKKMIISFRESKSICLSIKELEGIWKRILKLLFIPMCSVTRKFYRRRASICQLLLESECWCSPRSYNAGEARAAASTARSWRREGSPSSIFVERLRGAWPPLLLWNDIEGQQEDGPLVDL